MKAYRLFTAVFFTFFLSAALANNSSVMDHDHGSKKCSHHDHGKKKGHDKHKKCSGHGHSKCDKHHKKDHRECCDHQHQQTQTPKRDGIRIDFKVGKKDVRVNVE
ncbi:hypothetical protein K6119_18815 [Paracrocinitomix mangrovi]|uniref:hypothetical protein n=1 Tax=Paracrocinitomix mangrovi TaxID=2862509 RepID=UPI001C8EB233|nr:hypothetical protein [Paracrocinitomix mangrovi]UKN01779.1 hypothetical protein K6119_18815 [Paracrocinitomix mangrovi]